MAMRVAGNKEGEGNKAMAMATRIAGKWTAMVTKMVMATATRVAGKQRQWQQRGQWQRQQGKRATKRVIVMAARAMMTAMRVVGKQQQLGQWQHGWWASNGDKVDSNATAMATIWVMAMATRLVGKEEGKGKGSKGSGDGNEGGGQQTGQGRQGNGNGNKGGGQADNDSNKEGDGNKDEGGR
jgi:hypothetical protein